MKYSVQYLPLHFVLYLGKSITSGTVYVEDISRHLVTTELKPLFWPVQLLVSICWEIFISSWCSFLQPESVSLSLFRHLKLFARTFWAKLKNSIHAVLYTYIAVRGMTRKVSFQKPGFIKLSVVIWSLRICRNPRFSNCPKILSPTGSGWACKWELAGPVPGMVNAVLHQFPRTFPAKKQPEEDYRDGLGAAFSSLENKCHGMRAFRVYCTLPSPI